MMFSAWKSAAMKGVFSGLFLYGSIGRQGLAMLLTRENHPVYDAKVMLKEVAREMQPRYSSRIVAAKLDNVLRDLQTPVGNYSTIDFTDLASEDGCRIYRRSVIFLLVTAVAELYPEAEVIVRFSANKGLYCDIRMDGGLDGMVVRTIENRMRTIIQENRPIVKRSLHREEAVRLFKESKQIAKVNLISALQQEYVSIYYCGGVYDYLYGAMLTETGELGKFALDYYSPGVLLRTPEQGEEIPAFIEQPKLLHILGEAKRWANILHCDYIPDLNRYNHLGRSGELIRVSEALHEKKIAEIADFITRSIKHTRVVLIAGPSSSGKTSFAQRLKIQLRVNGLNPISLSLDDYYRNREDTPRNERGEYDFEALEALDVPLFNDQLVKLLAGEAVVPPRYNFTSGEREWDGNLPVSINPSQPIIIEGIHGLNEKLTVAVPRSQKYKIYVSALTQLNIDGHNRIPTTDARLIRRLVRDYQFRSSSALKTLQQWPDVRAGEEKNIFPFQEDADAVFNSALIYELAVLKKYAEPLLRQVPVDAAEYCRAQRLLEFCVYFDDIVDEDDIPNNSILREFIGHSCFFTSSGEPKP